MTKLREEFRHLPAGTRLPTIREISGQLSVSQFSVQRAFEVLKEEGYIRSFIGRGSFAVGFGGADRQAVSVNRARVLIVSHATPSARGSEITQQLQGQLQEFGHKVNSVSYTDASDLKDLLGRGGFNICVLQPRRSVLPVECLALLRAKASYMIVEGRNLELTDVDVYVRNRAKSIAVALRHLRERGHQVIGLLTERLGAAAGYAEIENLFRQLNGSSDNCLTPFVARVDIKKKNRPIADVIGQALENELRNCEAPPTAFVVSGRFASSEIREGFQRVHLKIPRDVGVVHLRNAPGKASGKPEFTTVGRSPQHVASGMADLVQWRLEHPMNPPGLVLDDPTLVVGSSTPYLAMATIDAGC